MMVALIDKKCRVCLTDQETTVKISKHVEVINELLPITIEENDGFGDKICHKCLFDITLCGDLVAKYKDFKSIPAENKCYLCLKENINLPVHGGLFRNIRKIENSLTVKNILRSNGINDHAQWNSMKKRLRTRRVCVDCFFLIDTVASLYDRIKASDEAIKKIVEETENWLYGDDPEEAEENLQFVELFNPNAGGSGTAGRKERRRKKVKFEGESEEEDDDEDEDEENEEEEDDNSDNTDEISPLSENDNDELSDADIVDKIKKEEVFEGDESDNENSGKSGTHVELKEEVENLRDLPPVGQKRKGRKKKVSVKEEPIDDDEEFGTNVVRDDAVSDSDGLKKLEELPSGKKKRERKRKETIKQEPVDCDDVTEQTVNENNEATSSSVGKKKRGRKRKETIKQEPLDLDDLGTINLAGESINESNKVKNPEMASDGKKKRERKKKQVINQESEDNELSSKSNEVAKSLTENSFNENSEASAADKKTKRGRKKKEVVEGDAVEGNRDSVDNYYNIKIKEEVISDENVITIESDDDVASGIAIDNEELIELNEKMSLEKQTIGHIDKKSNIRMCSWCEKPFNSDWNSSHLCVTCLDKYRQSMAGIHAGRSCRVFITDLKYSASTNINTINEDSDKTKTEENATNELITKVDINLSNRKRKHSNSESSESSVELSLNNKKKVKTGIQLLTERRDPTLSTSSIDSLTTDNLVTNNKNVGGKLSRNLDNESSDSKVNYSVNEFKELMSENRKRKRTTSISSSVCSDEDNLGEKKHKSSVEDGADEESLISNMKKSDSNYLNDSRLKFIDGWKINLLKANFPHLSEQISSDENDKVDGDDLSDVSLVSIKNGKSRKPGPKSRTKYFSAEEKDINDENTGEMNKDSDVIKHKIKRLGKKPGPLSKTLGAFTKSEDEQDNSLSSAENAKSSPVNVHKPGPKSKKSGDFVKKQQIDSSKDEDKSEMLLKEKVFARKPGPKSKTQFVHTDKNQSDVSDLESYKSVKLGKQSSESESDKHTTKKVNIFSSKVGDTDKDDKELLLAEGDNKGQKSQDGSLSDDSVDNESMPGKPKISECQSETPNPLESNKPNNNDCGKASDSEVGLKYNKYDHNNTSKIIDDIFPDSHRLKTSSNVTDEDYDREVENELLMESSLVASNDITKEEEDVLLNEQEDSIETDSDTCHENNKANESNGVHDNEQTGSDKADETDDGNLKLDESQELVNGDLEMKCEIPCTNSLLGDNLEKPVQGRNGENFNKDSKYDICEDIDASNKDLDQNEKSPFDEDNCIGTGLSRETGDVNHDNGGTGSQGVDPEKQKVN